MTMVYRQCNDCGVRKEFGEAWSCKCESPKREWVGLTDEEYEQFSQWTHIEIIERIVSLLKEKNT